MRDTDTIGRTMTRLLCTAAAVAVIGVLFAGAPARAEDDDEPVRDDGIMGNLMKGLGASDGSGGINYRERSPLVVPRNLTLPQPEQRRPESANWPKDPDVLEKRAAREAARKRDRAKENDRFEQIKIQPEPDLGAARARTATVAPQPGLSEGNRQLVEQGGILTPSQLGVTSSLRNLFGVKRDDEVKFTAEPPRESLTQPPPGYQTPSAGYGYGVSGDYRTQQQRQEAERQNPPAVLPPGRF